MHDANDMDLLRQYAAGHSDPAFAELVSRHVNLVYSTALRQTGNPHAAEEITQAVFIILAQKAGRIAAPTILPGWLYQTARLTAASFLRREGRRVRREQEAYMQTELHPTTPAEIWAQIAPLLEDAMGQLGEKDRAAVVLRFFGGKSFAEVAATAGVSENAAKKRVSRALAKLHSYFAKRGVSSTAAIIAGAITTNSVQAAPITLAKSVTAVAIAKGTAASGSTLMLVKGTMKMMTGIKIKLAFGICAAMFFVGGAVAINKLKAKEISFEAEGTVTYATAPDSRGSYTDTKHFIVARKGNTWKIRTTTEKQERAGLGGSLPDPIDLYYEMGFDGTNIYTLEQQDKEKLLPTIPAKALQTGNYIFAEGRVEKASSPPCMDTEQLCPVWLAYCSAPYFASLKDDSAVSPLFPTRNFFNERIPHMQLPAKWNLNDNLFIKDVSWFSDGTIQESGSDGKILIQKYRAPYDGAFLYGHLENSSWTNWNGLSLPGSFKITVYRPSYQEGPNEKPTFVVAYTIIGTLEAVRKVEEFSPVPQLNMETHITDSRIMRGGSPVSYATTNHWDYSAALKQW